jgi:hypothetical protein
MHWKGEDGKVGRCVVAAGPQMAWLTSLQPQERGGGQVVGGVLQHIPSQPGHLAICPGEWEVGRQGGVAGQPDASPTLGLRGDAGCRGCREERSARQEGLQQTKEGLTAD